MDLFVEIVYVLITTVLVLVVLLQAGKGGGMGSALGGGASQSVFGGGGGADFLAKLTQGLAVGFMVCAVYLAYASTHSGSDRLQAMSEELESEKNLADGDQEVNYERVGPNPLRLPPAGSAPSDDAAEPTENAASAKAEAPEPSAAPAAPVDDPAEDVDDTAPEDVDDTALEDDDADDTPEPSPAP